MFRSFGRWTLAGGVGKIYMKIYWSPKSIPELADLPGKERRAIWRAGFGYSIRHLRTWVGFSIFVALLALWHFVKSRYMEGFSIWFRLPIYMTVFAGGYMVWYQMAVKSALPYIRKAIALYEQSIPKAEKDLKMPTRQ
jgi:hypothetical protein